MLAEKEVLVEAQVRNSRLYNLINAKWSKKGKPNVAAFCREAGIEQQATGKLLNLRISPIADGGRFVGQYSPVAQRIAAHFKVDVEELFPLTLYRRVVKSKTMIAVSLVQLPYIEKVFIDHSMRQDVPVIDQVLIEQKISEEGIYESC